MSLTFEQKLQNYADLAVQIGVGLRAGQRLIIRAPVEAAPLVRLMTESAYKAGARLVDPNVVPTSVSSSACVAAATQASCMSKISRQSARTSSSGR